jgi:hypothetical protein
VRQERLGIVVAMVEKEVLLFSSCQGKAGVMMWQRAIDQTLSSRWSRNMKLELVAGVGMSLVNLLNVEGRSI